MTNYHIGYARIQKLPSYEPQYEVGVPRVTGGISEVPMDLPEGEWMVTFSYVLPGENMPDKQGNTFWAMAVYRYQQVKDAPDPTPDPTPEPGKVFVKDFAQAKAAIEKGATHLQTSGITIDNGDTLDFRGATIELVKPEDVRNRWNPAIRLRGSALIKNARIKTPATEGTGPGRIFYYGVVVDTGQTVGMSNVLFDDQMGMCIHVVKGTFVGDNVWAHKFSEYWIYQEKDTYVKCTNSGVKNQGGSSEESCYRSSGGRYRLENCTIDNRGGGKAALRGDAPAFPDGSPGGVLINCQIFGQIGPNPLSGDDGGQMVGIDRWRTEQIWLYQPSYIKKDEVTAYAQQLRGQKKSKRDIIRLIAEKFIRPDDLQSATRSAGKVKLSDMDLDLTVQFREAELARNSSVSIFGTKIVGAVRLISRMKLTFTDCTIEAVPDGDQVILGNSEAQYPIPNDRILDAAEVSGPPDVMFVNTTIVPNSKGLGIDPKLDKWVSALKFDSKSKITATK